MHAPFEILGAAQRARHGVEAHPAAAEDLPRPERPAEHPYQEWLDAGLFQLDELPQGDYVRAVGVADKATGAPMQTDFFQRIGSLTKTFTVTGVLQLARDGLLSLDDPIDRYVPGVPSGSQITLRELARANQRFEDFVKEIAALNRLFQRKD